MKKMRRKKKLKDRKRNVFDRSHTYDEAETSVFEVEDRGFQEPCL